MTFMVFLLCLGAGARLTRLITDDSITSRLRVFVIRHTGYQSALSTLITCAWCFSMWVYGGLFTLGYFFGDQPWFIWPAAALSASWLYAITATHLDGGPAPQPASTTGVTS